MKPTTKNGSKVEMSVYVGIDIHKRFCQAALMDEQGLILEELKFENNLEGVHSLVNLARCETYKSSSLVGSVRFTLPFGSAEMQGDCSNLARFGRAILSWVKISLER
jgi:hypothetical protein